MASPNILRVVKGAAEGARASRVAELVSQVRGPRSISPSIESMLDEALGVTDTSPPLATDPPKTVGNKAFGLLAAGSPGEVSVQMTPRDMLSRWYENTEGGLDGAVESSQEALRKYGIVYPHSNSPSYGEWAPENVDAPARVKIDPALGDFGPRGSYGAGGVRLNPAILNATKGRNATLEHELTHHLTLHGTETPDEPTLLAVQRAGNRRERFDSTPEGSVTLQNNPSLARSYDSTNPPEVQADAERSLRPLVDRERYVMSRVELDPRVAEVRRRYAYHTGHDVTTPEGAAKAWDWYRANRHHFEDLSAPYEFPTMQRSDFDIYDSLPMDSKNILFTRMTQVPAVMAPVAAGGGLLEGLRKE